LGSIAFPLYLVHYLVFQTGRTCLVNAIWKSLVVDSPYPWGQHDRAMDNPTPFSITWVGSGLIIKAFTIAAAHFHACFVQPRLEGGVDLLDGYMLVREGSEHKGD
jgi:peptidoglycan/LPS O-acetylase OafA/YrhL